MQSNTRLNTSPLSSLIWHPLKTNLIDRFTTIRSTPLLACTLFTLVLSTPVTGMAGSGAACVYGSGGSTTLECGRDSSTGAAFQSVAVGPIAQATAHFSTAVGYAAEATADRSIALGGIADATADYSIALGYNANATAVDSVAMGAAAFATATRSIALGDSTRALGISSIALGGDGADASTFPGAEANADYSIAIGADALADNLQSIALGDQSIAQGNQALALGPEANSSGEGSIALGHESIASAFAAQAIGPYAEATAVNAIAIGYNAQVYANNGTAIGALGPKAAASAAAIGANAEANGVNSTALGRLTRANGPSSFAAGIGSEVSTAATRSTAIGYYTNVTGTHALALGEYAQASHAYSMAIGNGTSTNFVQTYGNDNISIGTDSANYTLSGLGHGVAGQLYTVLVDANGNLSAQDLNAGTTGFASNTNTRTTLSANPVNNSTASLKQLTGRTAAATAQSTANNDDQNARIEQLFELVEKQQQSIATQQSQIDALLSDKQSLTQRITQLESNTNKPAALLPAVITQQGLQNAGFDFNTANTIVSTYDQTQSSALTLRHDATREGWLFSTRFRQAMVNISDQFIKAIGIDNFKQLIDASGDTAEIVVQQVLPQSSADNAGILPDDVIVEYDGQPVYSHSALMVASVKESTDENVLVRLLRNGQPVDVYLARGPLGIRTAAYTDDPCLWCAGGL